MLTPITPEQADAMRNGDTIVATLVLAAVAQTGVALAHPNADIILRIRKGSLLPDIEITDRIKGKTSGAAPGA